jgi:hypothetical protein
MDGGTAMRWCDNEQNDFPDGEFSIHGGTLYHCRPGGSRHPAGPGSVTTEDPANRPYGPYALYGAADGAAEEDYDGGADGGADGAADGAADGGADEEYDGGADGGASSRD